MSVNVKSIAQKYDLTVNGIESFFYTAQNGARNIGGINASDDLVSKFFIDLMEENGIPPKFAEKIADHYVYDLDKQNEAYKENLTKKILTSSKEPIQIVREELNKEIQEDDNIQTSGEINQTLGMSKKNPKYDYEEIYGDSV